MYITGGENSIQDLYLVFVSYVYIHSMICKMNWSVSVSILMFWLFVISVDMFVPVFLFIIGERISIRIGCNSLF